MAPAEMRMSIEAGSNWAVCRIGGRFIPLDREKAEGICRQVLDMIDRDVPEVAHPASQLTVHKAVI